MPVSSVLYTAINSFSKNILLYKQLSCLLIPGDACRRSLYMHYKASFSANCAEDSKTSGSLLIIWVVSA